MWCCRPSIMTAYNRDTVETIYHEQLILYTRPPKHWSILWKLIINKNGRLGPLFGLFAGDIQSWRKPEGYIFDNSNPLFSVGDDNFTSFMLMWISMRIIMSIHKAEPPRMILLLPNNHTLILTSLMISVSPTLNMNNMVATTANYINFLSPRKSILHQKVPWKRFILVFRFWIWVG